LKIFRAALVFVSALILISCQSTQYLSYLNIYNINEAKSIDVVLHDISFNSGMLKGKLKDGTVLKGNYFFNFNEPAVRPPGMIYNTVEEFLRLAKPDTTKTDEEIKEQLVSTFPDLYGYGAFVNAKPVGSAILVSDTGLSIELVFYNIIIKNRTGDGVGIDNEGNYYRVYLNTKSVYK
jgi:hypothetical protein